MFVSLLKFGKRAGIWLFLKRIRHSACRSSRQAWSGKTMAFPHSSFLSRSCDHHRFSSPVSVRNSNEEVNI